MKQVLKGVAVTVAAAGAVLAGAGVASATPTLLELPAAPDLLSGPPVSCLTPALEDPAGTVGKTLADPAGAIKADVDCLSGKG